jgi:hypothetical protein
MMVIGPNGIARSGKPRRGCEDGTYTIDCRIPYDCVRCGKQYLA